jgi:hypothetical protein
MAYDYRSSKGDPDNFFIDAQTGTFPHCSPDRLVSEQKKRSLRSRGGFVELAGFRLERCQALGEQLQISTCPTFTLLCGRAHC